MRKKLVSLLLLAGILLLALPQGWTSASERAFGRITAQDVNLRKEANTTSDILAALPLGSEVEVLGEDGSFYRVLYENLVGYVHFEYILADTTSSRAAYVLQDGVKLRGAPSEAAYVVAALSSGQGVKVKDMIGEWYFVVAGDSVGYVHRTYLTMTRATNTSSSQLKMGMEGQEVKRMQTELYERGFLAKVDISGSFAAKTREAVREFQKACDIDPDGVAGATTLEMLYDVNNKISKANALATQVKGSVELLDWFKGGNEWFKKYTQMTVIDVKTGISFNIRRFGGWYHADSEPLTASDTANFKKIVNGKWTWDRRAIWVSYRGRVVAASMNCMPHLSSPTKTNNFPGHFCIHLYNSKVHENSKECPRHQSKVQAAYKAGR